MVLGYSSLGSLGKRTKTGWGARRIGGRVDCGRQREVEDSGGTMGRRPRGEWGWDPSRVDAQRKRRLMGEGAQH